MDINYNVTENIKSFDLNIEKILENWEVYHAIREIIANALDEQFLSGTEDIKIQKKDGVWHVVDYGRGLSYYHLTQNENEEKIQSDKLIGRFGVGLKDALATLYRYGINIQITSKHGIITLDESVKEGFNDIVTLHAKIIPTNNVTMQGTDFSLDGCTDEDMYKAKKLFLKFTDDNVLETTTYGQVIENNGLVSSIYINGVKIAEEPNFLFSYNITSLNKQIVKALNRERTNIGRSAYTERVKSILLICNEDSVINSLINDLQEFSSGNKHDELQWSEIQLYASKKLANSSKNFTFITPDEIMQAPSIVDDMSRSGYSPVVIPKKLEDKIKSYNENANEEEVITTVSQYLSQQKEKFQPKFIEQKDLTEKELFVYNKTEEILSLIGGCPVSVLEIKIADNIYSEELYNETVGLWQSASQRILVKRKQLSSVLNYAGTLLHECAHAESNADDVSRTFESQLTNYLGKIVNEYFKYIDGLYIEDNSKKDLDNDIDSNIKKINERINAILK